MDSNNYCNHSLLHLNVKNQKELIKLVAREVGISEDELERKAKTVKRGWYKGNLTYWQLLDIATKLKNSSSKS